MNDDALHVRADSSGIALTDGDMKTSFMGRCERKSVPELELPEKLPDPEFPAEFLSAQRHPRSIELGHYDVLETIGRGGFGVVVKAFDQKLQRVVAIKTMTAEIAATSPARKRFVREARAGAAVRHDNVVRIYAVEESPIPYLVMEFVPGMSLQDYLDKNGPLAVREVLRIGAQIAWGLAAAHATGLVHRDIKPANVLLEDGLNSKVKLTDFGLARAADDASLSQSGMVVGTPMYMSPEQARGEDFDHRADLYSLGSVLYVMVTGRPPFRASNTLAVLKRVAEASPRPVREIIPETPAWLCDIIAKLQAPKPEDRFHTAAEVAGILEMCLANLSTCNGVPTPVPPPKPRASWWGTAVAAGSLLCAAVAVGFAAFRPTPTVEPEIADEPVSVAAALAPTTAPPTPVPSAFTNSLGMEFVGVPAGRLGRDAGGEVANITIPYDFFIGKYEVTHEEWEKVMGVGTSPSRYTRSGSERDAVAAVADADLKRFPVENVSWNDCQNFVGQLNRRAKESGWVYRLPTGPEWEYACRNGPGQSSDALRCEFSVAEPARTLTAEQANTAISGLNRPCRVGSYPPNRLGIHDMHGNAMEHLDDMAPAEPRCRLNAGGRWVELLDGCAASSRVWAFPDIRMPATGLRVVRVPVDAPPTPRQQFEAVVADLRQLNPGFAGQVTPTIRNSQVTGVTILEGVGIADIAPLRKLRYLEVFNTWHTSVSDLYPLAGLPLRELRLMNDRALTDLTPLRGMRLEILDAWGFTGTDLSPLKGMPLKLLNIGGGNRKLDLEPIRGMPLKYLCVNCTAVDDISPITGMALESLLIENCLVQDLTPLSGMRLKEFGIGGTQYTDLSFLATLPLEKLVLDIRTEQDAELVRSIPTLTEVNQMSVAKALEEFAKSSK